MDAFLMVWKVLDMELAMSQEEQTIQISQEVKSERTDQISKYDIGIKVIVYIINMDENITNLIFLLYFILSSFAYFCNNFS